MLSLRVFFLRIVLLWSMLAPLCGWAQIRGRANALAGVDAAGNAQTVEAALHLMANQAAVVFIGSVGEIRRPDSQSGSGVVEIQFEVEQAIRGCSPGTYTLREWGGLWSANDSRYHPGQRLLLFLHAPGAAGLSSPVAGLDGAIPLRASGTGVGASSATTATADPVADLRWIGARLARTVSYRPSRPSSSLSPRANSVPAISYEAPSGSVSDSSRPAQETSVSAVVALIRSWEVADEASR